LRSAHARLLRSIRLWEVTRCSMSGSGCLSVSSRRRS